MRRSNTQGSIKDYVQEELRVLGEFSEDVTQKARAVVKDELTATDIEDHVFSSSLQRVSYKLLHAPLFEHFVSVIIMFNLILIVYETDLSAKGEESPIWITVCYWSFLALFMVESTLRLLAERCKFWQSPMNIWDLVVVIIDVALSARSVVGTEQGVAGVSAARFLRLLRLARASKALAVFPELRLMMGGLTGALSSIFWGTVLLFFALIIWGVLAVQLIQPLNLEVAESGAYAGCERCPRAYESVWQSALTFTTAIVCGDSWARETVPIIEAYPVSFLFFAGVFLSVGMALLNLILGVVVNAATEARDNIAKELVQKKAMHTLDIKNHLLAICAEMDADGSGELSNDELDKGFASNKAFKDTMFDLGIHTKEDLDVVYTIVDTQKDGSVSFNELVAQIYTMKSSEMEYMLAYVKFYMTKMRDSIASHMKSTEADLVQEVRRTEVANKSITDFNSEMRSVAAVPEYFIDEMRSVADVSEDYASNLAGNAAANKPTHPVMASASNREPTKHSLAAMEVKEDMKSQHGLQLAVASEPLLAQLQDLRKHFLTSSDDMRRAHADLLEATIQSITASSVCSTSTSDTVAGLCQKSACPSSTKVLM